MRRRRCCIVLSCLGVIFCVNICIIIVSLSDTSSNSVVYHKRSVRHYTNKTSNVRLIQVIEEIAKNIEVKQLPLNRRLHSLIKRLSQQVKPVPSNSTSANVWAIPEKWATRWQVLPESADGLASVLTAMQVLPIEEADVSRKGTQLKLLLTLRGNQKVLFKPQWYTRDYIVEGKIYDGKDRHNAEVAAFHLSRLVGLRKTPIATGRRINLHKEIIPKATPALLDTFFNQGNRTCFYGACYYCHRGDPVCTEDATLEGAIVLWLPKHVKLKRFPSPWGRTYKDNKKARWEVDDRYCDRLKQQRRYNTPLLLDLIDFAVFDFLIGNGDRHHYEVMYVRNSSGSALLLDNGKSFGDPSKDCLDILAPLYQCCVIRDSLWQRLLLLRGGHLSKALSKLMRTDPIHPVLTPQHLDSLDRRLAIVIKTVMWCVNSYPDSSVLIHT